MGAGGLGPGGLGPGGDGLGPGGDGDGERAQRIMQTTLFWSQLTMQSGRSGPLPMHPSAHENTCVKHPIKHPIMLFTSPGDGGFGVRSAGAATPSLLLTMLSAPLKATAVLAPPASATTRSTRREQAPAIVVAAVAVRVRASRRVVMTSLQLVVMWVCAEGINIGRRGEL